MKKLTTSILLGCALITAPLTVPILTTVILTTGCKAPQQVVAYKSLASLQVAVTQASNAFVAAVRAGKVPPEQVAKAIDASAKFNAAYNAAIEIAKTSDTPAPQAVADAASTFLNLVILFTQPR